MDTRYNELHKRAMHLVSEAIIIQDDDSKKYQELMREAFEIEKEAAYILYPRTDLEPARSILFQSAANIAYEIGLYEDSLKLIYAALSGNPPAHIIKNLHDLNETLQFVRHIVRENLEISENTLNISLYGPKVGNGIVEYSALKRKIDTIEKMLMRTIQRTKYPATFSSAKIYEIKKQHPTFIKYLEAGCVSVGFKVAIDESEGSDLIDRSIIESSIADLARDVELLNNDEIDKLKSRINNTGYFNSMVDLFQEILPDGEKISGINIAAKVESKTINFKITKTKADLGIAEDISEDDDPVAKAEIGSEITLQGYLRMADGIKKNTYVKLITDSSEEKEYTIYLDEATLDDVVSSYWDTLVKLKVHKKGIRKLQYMAIQEI